MAIVLEMRVGSAVVRLDDSCCQCPPEETALRHSQCDLVTARILSNPQTASALAEMYESKPSVSPTSPAPPAQTQGSPPARYA